MKKNITALIALATMAILLCSCAKRAEGYEIIKNARKEYTKYDSAKIIVTNDLTGQVSQEFTFKYEGDVLTYVYMGAGENGEIYYEYHNGDELHIYEQGEWAVYMKGDGKYQSYSRRNPHSMAGEGVFLFVNKAIDEARIEEIDGGTKIEYIYDAKELSRQMSRQLKEIGDIQSFEISFILNSDGHIEQMRQISTLIKTDENGDEHREDIDYKLEVSEINAVKEIKKPVIE